MAMSDAKATCPATKQQVIDLYFLEHRAKLLDIAAFLDRLDRADGEEDFRTQAFRRAMDVLKESEPGRAKRLLELLSDPTTEPIARAPGKGAVGAYRPFA
jgi:hypothetical protein